MAQLPYHQLSLARNQLTAAFVTTTAQHRILLLDDDPDLLDLYREILGSLPSRPEIHTATSGARAIALLEAEPFTLLLSDLNMPKMDGLQVLTIVRRKFPQLRTAVLTSVADEQFRARAYSMGIDLFLEKPNGSQEIRFMLDCVESLLGRDEVPGFRGIQNKSLVDIVQLECLSQSSSILRITNGPSEGRIWIQDGEVIDAAASDLTGEPAFKKILGWKTGNFETLPEEPGRERTIFISYQGLLLETAQSLDEAMTEDDTTPARENDPEGTPLEKMRRFHGVEFLVEVDSDPRVTPSTWGTENPNELAQWTHQTAERFRALGETLQVGSFNRLDGVGSLRHTSVVAKPGKNLCVGLNRSLSQDRVRDTVKKIICQWVS